MPCDTLPLCESGIELYNNSAAKSNERKPAAHNEAASPASVSLPNNGSSPIKVGAHPSNNVYGNLPTNGGNDSGKRLRVNGGSSRNSGRNNISTDIVFNN